MTKKEKIYQSIKEHGDNLNAIFNTGIESVILCKKLRRLEIKAHKLATDYCNGENGIDADNIDEHAKPILAKVSQLLKTDENDIHVFINQDARGYALKIGHEEAKDRRIYKDWGGYGILAPDFSID